MKQIEKKYFWIFGAFFFSPLHVLVAQIEFQSPFFLVKQPYNTPSSLRSSSTYEGRYIITPDDNGKMNFDTTLALKLQSALSSARATSIVRGACAAILIPNKGIWQGASGISSAVPLDSIQPDMLFSVASNTKTFTVSMIMKLVEDGKISLDDSLYKFLPKYNNIDSTITIRQLMNMTSGLFDMNNDSNALWDAVFADPTRRWKPEDDLSYVGPPKHSPGAKWRYTNTAYILLGMIITKTTGLPVPTFLHQRILDSLGLANTFFLPEDSLKGSVAHGWSNSLWQTPMQDISSFSHEAQMSAIFTAGAVWSTTENMARWVKKYYTGEVISSESMKKVQTYIPIGIAGPYNFRIEKYGLGTALFYYYGIPMWGHDGGIFGYFSLAVYLPEAGVSIVVLTNTSEWINTPDFSLYWIANAVIASYCRTREASLFVNTETINLNATNNKVYRDTSFVVSNIGGRMDSVHISLEPLSPEPESTFTVFPSEFALQPNDSQVVTLRTRTDTRLTAGSHLSLIYIDSKFAFDTKHWEKAFHVNFTTGVNEKSIAPIAFSLFQNYPNPFNPKTVVSYQLPAVSNVTLKIYDMLGREVAVLVNENKDGGRYSVSWDGERFAGGIYFYALQAGDFRETKKMILMK